MASSSLIIFLHPPEDEEKKNAFSALSCLPSSVVPLSRKNPGTREYKLFMTKLVTGTSSTFKLASIWGSSTRELARNEYASTRCFTPGNPGDDGFSAHKPRPLCSISYKFCRRPVYRTIKSQFKASHTNIEVPNTLCRTADRYSAMIIQQKSTSSNSRDHGSNPTEGEGQTSPKSVGGTQISNVPQGVAGAQQDTSSSINSNNSSSLIFASFL